MLLEHVRTLFLVSWHLPGREEAFLNQQEEEHPRKAEAMACARQRAAESWAGTAVVEMLVEEQGVGGPSQRMIRAWEVTPDACEQISGGRERMSRY